MRIEVGELSLASLDAARADSLVLFVGPERPLQGLAGLADWRLAGALSRALRGGIYRGGAGEQLLLPGASRLPQARVFCFGLDRPPEGEAAFRAVAYRTLDALLRAGSRSQVTSLPPAPGMAPPEVARLWLEATVRFPPERQVLLGEGAALRRDLSTARDALRIGLDLASLELEAPRAPSLPGSPQVLR